MWITAYARKNLWTGILEFKNDYVYSDTDSIKCVNVPDHMEYINKYNDIVINKLKKKNQKLALSYLEKAYEISKTAENLCWYT